MAEIKAGQAVETDLTALMKEADNLTVESFLKGKSEEAPPSGDTQLDSERTTNGDEADRDIVADSIEALGQKPNESVENEPEVDWEERLETERTRTKNAQGKMTEATESAATLKRELEQYRDIDPQEVHRLLKEEKQRQLAKKRKPLPIEEIREDHGDVLANAMQSMQEQNDTLLNEQTELKNGLAKQKVEIGEDAHYAEIEAAHPDFPEIYGSDEFKGFISNLPTLVRHGANHVLTSGTAKEVNELVKSYKTYANSDKENEGSHNRSVETAKKYANPPMRSKGAPSNVKTTKQGIDIGYLRKLAKAGKVFSDEEEKQYDDAIRAGAG